MIATEPLGRGVLWWAFFRLVVVGLCSTTLSASAQEDSTRNDGGSKASAVPAEDADVGGIWAARMSVSGIRAALVLVSRHVAEVPSAPHHIR
jgi:hypothetical protein